MNRVGNDRWRKKRIKLVDWVEWRQVDVFYFSLVETREKKNKNTIYNWFYVWIVFFISTSFYFYHFNHLSVYFCVWLSFISPRCLLLFIWNRPKRKKKYFNCENTQRCWIISLLGGWHKVFVCCLEKKSQKDSTHLE